jgi:formylglycine-generating enzyme required for sulfatase activity
MLRLAYDEHILSDQERAAITAAANSMVERFSQQPEKLNLIILESFSLGPVIFSCSRAVLQQNWFWRVFKYWTGVTENANLENEIDHARFACFTRESLLALEARQLFTSEALLVLDNHVCRLMSDLPRLPEGLVRMPDQVREIYHNLVTFARVQVERFNHQERTQDLEKWIAQLATTRAVCQDQHSDHEMPLGTKLVCLASEFFHQSRTQWTKSDWSSLEVCLKNVGVNPEDQVLPSLLYLDENRDRLLERWLTGVIEVDHLEKWATPWSTPLAFAFTLQHRYRQQAQQIYQGPSRDDIYSDGEAGDWQIVVKHIQEHSGRALDQPVPVHALLRDLIGNLFVLQTYISVAKPRSSTVALSLGGKPLPFKIQSIHGWSADRVQTLQQQWAEVLEKPVTFRDRLKSGDEGPDMLIIPAGQFLMGSPENEPERHPEEGPQHEVTFSQPFAIGRYPVTFDDYDGYCRSVRKDPPGDEGWGRGLRPVINVTWHDAQAYCDWLSEQTGRSYRLPSEAEWEYACRAGTITPFHWGSSIATQQANYNGNYAYNGGPKGEYRQRTLPVGQFEPNAFGLYDCHGNVFEWCEDSWHDDYRGAPQDGSAWRGSDSIYHVMRGGSWYYFPFRLRSAYRSLIVAAFRYNNWGFRLAQNLV